MSTDFAVWFLLATLLLFTKTSFGDDDGFFDAHDKQHINDHLDEHHQKKDENMSNEDMEFNYFKMHDYDNDNRLDGLEIAKSLMDHQKHDAEAPSLPDYKIEQVVNKVLQSEDLNKDGYVDYSEFIIAQRKLNKNKNKL